MVGLSRPLASAACVGSAALGADDGRAFACIGAYLGTGGLAFSVGTDDLTCKDRTNIAMSLCAVAGVRCCCHVDVWSTFLCPSLDEISAHNVGVCVTYPCYIYYCAASSPCCDTTKSHKSPATNTKISVVFGRAMLAKSKVQRHVNQHQDTCTSSLA